MKVAYLVAHLNLETGQAVVDFTDIFSHSAHLEPIRSFKERWINIIDYEDKTFELAKSKIEENLELMPELYWAYKIYRKR